MTPSDILTVIAVLGKRTKDAAEREALRAAYSALRAPPLEELRSLIPGSRVTLSLLEEDPVLGPWCAWIEWHENGVPRSLSVLAKTHGDALAALQETIEKRSIEIPKEPADLEHERDERIAIVREAAKVKP